MQRVHCDDPATYSMGNGSLESGLPFVPFSNAEISYFPSIENAYSFLFGLPTRRN